MPAVAGPQQADEPPSMTINSVNYLTNGLLGQDFTLIIIIRTRTFHGWSILYFNQHHQNFHF